MELGELMEQVNESADWLVVAIVALLVANLAAGGYLVYVYLSFENFYSEYGFESDTDFQEERERLQNIPELEDIEVEPPEEPEPLPEKYVELEGTELFTSLPERLKQRPELAPADQLAGDTGDTGVGDGEPTLPEIEGYEVLGRISGDDTGGISIINDIEESKTHVVRTGEYLGNTDIMVLSVSDTQVRLSSPEHRVTTFRFEVDLITEKIRNSITKY